MAIDITTISVEMDTSSLKAGQTALNETAKAGDKLATSATGAGKAAKSGFDDVAKAALKSEQATAQASVGMNRLRGIAQNAGYQLQDVAVQAQMGASAFTILGQQGSQFASAFGPTGAIVGAIIAVGSAVGGVLFKSFMDASKAMEEMTENTKKLVKEYKEFNEEQQKIVNKGLGFTIADQNKKYEEQTKLIDDQIKKIKELNEENGKKKIVFAGGAGGGTATEITINNTKAIADAEKQLNAVQQQKLLTLKEIEAMQDPTGATAKIKAIQDEAALVGLLGKEYWEVKAAQEGITGAAQKEYIANNLLLESKLKAEKEKQDAIKKTQSESEKAANKLKADSEKAIKDEEARAEKIKSIVTSINREKDLMSEQSKEAQIRYEIEKGILQVKGGILGIEAQSLINAAKLYDKEKASYDAQKAYKSDMIRWIDDQKDAQDKAIDDAKKKAESSAKSISDALTDALMRGFESGKGFAENLKDTVVNMFKSLVLKPVIQPLMDKASGAISGIIGSTGSSGADGKTSGGAGMLGMLGPYGAMAAAAVAIGGAMVSKFNEKQDAQFAKMTAEYRQGNQSTGTLLGNANIKSDSINKSLEAMGDNGASLLDVNHGMYQALLDIKTGIAGSAAGFARTIGRPIDYKTLGINQGTSSLSRGFVATTGIGAGAGIDWDGFIKGTGGGELDTMVSGFLQSISDEINKAVYRVSSSVIDSGIQILGTSLAEILESGAVGAMTYADVKLTRRVFGIKSGTNVKTETGELDDIFEKQFAQIFDGAGRALEEASKAFGVGFDASKLLVDATKLSLKGLQGDALVKEIEHFFSSTLDKWSQSILQGTDVLIRYQEVGEGAFETMLRLASQTNIFTSYAEKLLPKFNLVGIAAIDAAQELAKLSGGFDRLNTNMGSYYENFFSESEKSQRGLSQIADALASVGLAMPKTREEFRALVEKLDLTSDAQRKQYAALLDVNQAFAQLVPASKDAAEATKELVNTFDAIAEQQKTLSDRLFEITATEAEKRKRELDSALSDENRALQAQIHAAIDAKNAADDLAAAQEDMASAAIRAAEEMKAKLESIANERYSIETELLQLQGDTAALRRRELESLDPSNRALKEQIYALIDAKDAAEKAEKAQEEQLKAQNAALKAQEEAQRDQQRAQEEAMNDARKAADEQRKLAQGVHDSISSALKSLMGESETLNAMTQSQARLTLQNALMTAKAGGSLVGFAGLDDALGAIQKQGTYSSSLESRLAMGRNIGLLSELAKYTKVDGSHANGLESVPYDGYIAQLHKGERVQTAKEAQANSDLAAKVDRLIEVVNAGNIAIAQNTAKSAKSLEKWDNDGMPETRSVA